MNMPKAEVGMSAAAVKLNEVIMVGTIVEVNETEARIRVKFDNGGDGDEIYSNFHLYELTCRNGFMAYSRLILGRPNEKDVELVARIKEANSAYEQLDNATLHVKNASWTYADAELMREVTEYIRNKMIERRY